MLKKKVIKYDFFKDYYCQFYCKIDVIPNVIFLDVIITNVMHLLVQIIVIFSRSVYDVRLNNTPLVASKDVGVATS